MSQTKFYLTKRDNRFYYICIKYLDGKTGWKTTKCGKKPEALHFHGSFEEAFYTAKNVQMPTFSEFLKMFEAVQSSVIRKSTIELYKTLADKFLKLNFDKPLNTYTSLEFEQTRAKEIARGLSIARMNLYIRAIKTMFNFATKQNIIAVNPLENVKQIKQSKIIPAFFSFTDLEKIVGLVQNQKLKEIFIFAFLTGMRISENINLRWVNVDFENNQIRISNSADFTTKTGKERSIPIHAKIRELLDNMDKSHEFIFTKYGNLRYSRHYISHRFKSYATKTGLPENIKFHSIRHSFASLCVQSGVDIYSVQQLLGHSDVATTQIYAHLTLSHLQSAVDKIRV